MPKTQNAGSIEAKAAAFHAGYFRSTRWDDEIVGSTRALVKRFPAAAAAHEAMHLATQLSVLTAIPIPRGKLESPDVRKWRALMGRMIADSLGRYRGLVEAQIANKPSLTRFFRLGGVFDRYRGRRYSLGEEPRGAVRWLIVRDHLAPFIGNVRETIEVLRSRADPTVFLRGASGTGPNCRTCGQAGARSRPP